MALGKDSVKQLFFPFSFIPELSVDHYLSREDNIINLFKIQVGDPLDGKLLKE